MATTAYVPQIWTMAFFQEVVEKNLRITQDTMKKRDDAESVDNDSTMSTSSNLEPFANDDLGIYKCVWGKFLFLKFHLEVFIWNVFPSALNYKSGTSSCFFPAGLVSAGFGKPISLHVRINK